MAQNCLILADVLWKPTSKPKLNCVNTKVKKPPTPLLSLVMYSILFTITQLRRVLAHPVAHSFIELLIWEKVEVELKVISSVIFY